MTFTAIVTAHTQDPRRILGNLRYQSRKPDEVILLYSGDIGDVARIREDFRSTRIIVSRDRQDWGHHKRDTGLQIAKGDAIGWFNADDSYDIHYIEKMMAPLEAGADVVFCNWTPMSRFCTFHPGSSTSGNFIVRTALAREAGWSDRHYEADGTFIDRVKELAPDIRKVEEFLYIHH